MALIRNGAGLTAAEMRDFVKVLYSEGKTDQQIADYVGIHRAGITKLRNAMNLPAQWGKPDKGFTEAEDKALVSLHEDWGFSWAAIARGLGYDTKQARLVSDRYVEIEDQREAAKTRAAKPVEKKCLRCRKPFMTVDPKKEWYCGPHREAAASYGDYADEHRLAL